MKQKKKLSIYAPKISINYCKKLKKKSEEEFIIKQHDNESIKHI